MPQIFLRRRADYPDYNRDKNEYPACIVLDKNFRSRRGVTEAVNFVFRQLMSEQTGELDYTKAEELVAGAEYPPCDEPAAQLDIIDLSVSENEDDMITAESRHIAELIYRMTGDGTTVTDKGKARPVVYRDICILLRSANKYAHACRSDGAAWAGYPALRPAQACRTARPENRPPTVGGGAIKT